MKAIISSEFTTADELLSQQNDILGSIPSSWWHAWEQRDQYFDGYGYPKEGRYIWPQIDKAFEEGVREYRRESTRVNEFDAEETTAILDLMRRMLVIRPGERPAAEQVLESEWMVKWVLPSLNMSMDVQ